MKLTRRKFFLGSLFAAAGVYVDMRYIEPGWLKVSHVPVRLFGKSAGVPIRILHISDLHAVNRSTVSLVDEAVTLGMKCQPHLICLTGDLISRLIPERDYYLSVLKRLSIAAPAYACAGNHDGGAWVAPLGGYQDLSEMSAFLKEAGVELMVNAATRLTLNGVAVDLVGLGDLWAHNVKPAVAFKQLADDSKVLRIVMSHNPDSKDLVATYNWDLMLCGHTHGGQLSLPFLGTPFAPVKDQKFVSGLNAWNDRLIYITKGVGNLHGLRFNCRPEVSLLTIT